MGSADSSLTITPVVLSGGGGTRLWPVSTILYPKQLLKLAGDQSMLQQTVMRAVRAGYANPILVGSAGQSRELVAQLEAIQVSPQMLILEPVAKNTAPAIALAALSLNAEAILLVMPSDHVVSDEVAFRQAVGRAESLARDGWIVALGVTPTRAETGYGYIEAGRELAPGVFAAKRFVEKPPADLAQQFLASGSSYWNAGIFVMRADRYLASLRRYQPAIFEASVRALDGAHRDGLSVFPGEHFAASPSISIDHAIMEKDIRVAVVPSLMGWSDVGSWDALYDISEADERQNVTCGSVRAFDTYGCFVRTDGPRVNLVGVSDLIVVATRGEILILRRGESQSVRKLAE
jgi:mannose-1-phosphate guanylyltransferase